MSQRELKFQKTIYSTFELLGNFFDYINIKLDDEICYCLKNSNETDRLLSYYYVSQSQEKIGNNQYRDMNHSVNFVDGEKEIGLLNLTKDDSGRILFQVYSHDSGELSIPLQKLNEKIEISFPDFPDPIGKEQDVLTNGNQKGLIIDLPSEILSKDFGIYDIFKNDRQMKKYYKGYVYSSMEIVVTSIKGAREMFDSNNRNGTKNFSRFSSGIIGYVAGFAPATTGRYLAILINLGVKKVDNVFVPHRSSESNKSNKSK